MPFTDALRTATMEAHTAAEGAPFIAQLLAGKLDADAWTHLLRELAAVYAELERAEAEHAEDPLLAPFCVPELRRLNAIRADLVTLGADPDEPARCAATLDYCRRIDDAAAAGAPGVLGHHYTRILGDLSGGQIIAVMLQRHYGIPAHALTFLDFDGTSPRRRADAYRAALDAAPLTDADRQQVIAASLAAYSCNAAIFDELGRQLMGAPA